MMKIDELIEKFKEFKEELNKQGDPLPDAVAMAEVEKTNGAAASGPTLGSMIGFPGAAPTAPVSSGTTSTIKAEELKIEKNGQWSLKKKQYGINVEDVSLRGKEKPIKVMPPSHSPTIKKGEEQFDQNKAPGRHAAHGI
jgi:hypothetical protein